MTLKSGAICLVILPNASVSVVKVKVSASKSSTWLTGVQLATSLYFLKSLRVAFTGCPLKSYTSVSIKPPVSYIFIV